MQVKWNSIEKQSIMKILIDITSADGISDDKELKYISDISLVFEMSDIEVITASKLPVIQAILNLSRMSSEKKIVMTNTMRKLIEIDGHIHKKEMELYNATCLYMGL